MKEKERYISLPEDWDELSQDDWRDLLRMRQQTIDRGMKVTVDDVRTETARLMLRNRGVRQQTDNQQWVLLVSQLARTLTWLWEERDEGISLVYRSTRNLLPRVKAKDKVWTGPKSYGEDLTFGEFRMMVALLHDYEQSLNPRALDVLAGLLYRPLASEQQRHEQQLIRQPYDWDDFTEKERRGKRMQRWQVWGIYAWAAYFCEALTTDTFVVDGVELCFAPIFGKPGKGEGGGKGSMLQVGLTLAESRVFGTLRDVDHTPLLTVMQKLLADYEALQRMKKQSLKKTEKS